MSAKILSYYDYDRDRTISCPCGWSGTCSDHEDYFTEVLDVRCAKCDRMLLIVGYPSDEQTLIAAAAGNKEALRELEATDRWESEIQGG